MGRCGSIIEYIYNTYKKQMWVVANSILCDAYEAEDAVHEAIFSMMKHEKDIDISDAQMLRAYVLTVAKHKAMDIYNKRKKVISLDVKVDVHDQTVYIEEKIEKKMNAQALLQSLSNEDAEMVMLKYYFGYTAYEIARLLSVKPNTVIKRLSRIRRALQDRKGVDQYEKGD